MYKKPTEIVYKGKRFQIGEEVRIYTGNYKGTIPPLPDYRGTIVEIISNELLMLNTEDEGPLRVHAGRLHKLEEGTLKPIYRE